MDIGHINASVKITVELPVADIKKLMQENSLKKIAVTATTQFIGQLEDMLKSLESQNIEVAIFKGRHTRLPGQVLGCDAPIISNDEADSFLYIGDGFFHPNEILLHNEKPVIAFNPFSKKLEILDPSDVEDIKKKKKGNYLKFLNAKNIGVIITVKPGQNFFRASLNLEKKYPDKNFYYIIFNTVEFGQLENFNFIECWVNTACSRIGVDDLDKFEKPVVNLEDVLTDFK